MKEFFREYHSKKEIDEFFEGWLEWENLERKIKRADIQFKFIATLTILFAVVILPIMGVLLVLGVL